MVLVDKSKISTFDFIFLFITIIVAGRATIFAREFGSITSLCTYLLLGLSLISFIIHKPSDNREYIKLLVFAIGYLSILFVVNHFFAIGNFFIWFVNITVFYALWNSLKGSFLVAYETVLFYLCIIAICLWVVYIVFPGYLESLMLKWRFSDSYSDSLNVINSLVYTIYNDHTFDANFFSIPRNCGYAWEPGAFACFICFGIYSNILRKNFQLKKNPVLIVFIVALLSTQSTTGMFVMALMVVLGILLNRKYLYLILFIPLLLYLWRLSFVGEKFLSEVSGITAYGNEDVGRLSSFLIYWEDFKQHPIFGGMGNTSSYIFQKGYAEHLYSGIGQMLSYYGIVFTVVFVYCTVKTSIQHNILYSTNGGFMLLAIVIGTLISYNFWDQPLIMCFWLSGVLSMNEVNGKIEISI